LHSPNTVDKTQIYILLASGIFRGRSEGYKINHTLFIGNMPKEMPTELQNISRQL